jgi:hypothetical protein
VLLRASGSGRTTHEPKHTSNYLAAVNVTNDQLANPSRQMDDKGQCHPAGAKQRGGGK